MKVNIVSWNVRGLNRKKKRDMIKSLIQSWRADVFCFQESKLEGDVRNVVKELWANRWVKFARLEASGPRGIIMLWDSRIWEGEISSLGLIVLLANSPIKTRTLHGTYLVSMLQMI